MRLEILKLCFANDGRKLVSLEDVQKALHTNASSAITELSHLEGMNYTTVSHHDSSAGVEPRWRITPKSKEVMEKKPKTYDEFKHYWRNPAKEFGESIKVDTSTGGKIKKGISITYKIILSAGAIAAVIISIAGVMAFFPGTLPNTEGDINNIAQDSGQIVQSFNQSGGITTGSINVNPIKPDRHLNDQWTAALNQKLPEDKNKMIEIFVIVSDPEAYQFASEIKTYLDSQGWNTSRLQESFFSPPIVGQEINEYEEYLEIKISSNK